MKTICFNHFSLLMVPVQVSPFVPFLLYLFPRCYPFFAKERSLLLRFSRGRGLTVTSAHLLVRAPIDGPSDTQRPHTMKSVRSRPMKSVLSRPLWPCSHRMRAIVQRLGSLHRLAHAAENGDFFWLHHIWAHLLPLLRTIQH